MNGELLIVLEHLEREKGIRREVLIDAIESSLLSASRKRLGKSENVSIKIDPETAEVHVYEELTVVKKITDPINEIELKKAKDIDPNTSVGEIVKKEITPENFGRIAAQTAKQVIIQKIREAEREIVYGEFKDRIGDITNGIIRRVERGNVVVDLGRTEAIVPYKEQSPNDDYRTGYRMRFYIVDVRTTSRGPEVILSRTHPGLVRCLFELEVPEINEGTVEVKAVAREPGYRTKIAVESKLEKVDSVGACVGLRGERVKTIVQELNGEKIDIVRYSSNISLFVENALSPAKIKSIELKEQEKSMSIIVNPDQFSLAIGKKGQNARLTSKLIGWRIDIKKVSDLDEALAAKPPVIEEIPGIPDKIFRLFVENEYNTLDKLEKLTEQDLMDLKGVGEKSASKYLETIKEFLVKEKSKTKLDSIIAETSKELKNM